MRTMGIRTLIAMLVARAPRLRKRSRSRDSFVLVGLCRASRLRDPSAEWQR